MTLFLCVSNVLDTACTMTLNLRLAHVHHEDGGGAHEWTHCVCVVLYGFVDKSQSCRCREVVFV